MNDSFIAEGISSVSALINNTLYGHSNSKRRITDVYFDISKIAKYDRTSYGRYRFLKENANKCEYNFHECTADTISEMTDGNTHGGIAASVTYGGIDYLQPDALKKDSFYCFLDGVDDPYNLGYIIRTMYTFGASGIILPENNKMNMFPSTVIKSAAGLTECMDIFISRPDDVCNIFKSIGYRIACAALRDSVSSCNADLKHPILLVIGGEKRGISRQILSQSDINIRIDYAIDFKGSLPSVSAASVLGYEINKQNSK